MKKRLAKITLKTDKIVNLSKEKAQNVLGGQRQSASFCTSKICEP
ncbi:class I lanthipeptide [Spirosoma gilvum]